MTAGREKECLASSGRSPRTGLDQAKQNDLVQGQFIWSVTSGLRGNIVSGDGVSKIVLQWKDSVRKHKIMSSDAHNVPNRQAETQRQCWNFIHARIFAKKDRGERWPQRTFSSLAHCEDLSTAVCDEQCVLTLSRQASVLGDYGPVIIPCVRAVNALQPLGHYGYVTNKLLAPFFSPEGHVHFSRMTNVFQSNRTGGINLPFPMASYRGTKSASRPIQHC